MKKLKLKKRWKYLSYWSRIGYEPEWMIHTSKPSNSSKHQQFAEYLFDTSELDKDKTYKLCGDSLEEMA